MYDYKTLLNHSLMAKENLMRHYWDPVNKHFINYTTSMVWEYGIVLFGLETLYEVTGDETLKEYFVGQMKYVEEHIGVENLVTVRGTDPNIANDDSGWNALAMMSTWRMTGYEKALDYAHDVIVNSYEYFKDGDVANGLWYRLADQFNPDLIGVNIKCMTCAALILAALDYSEVTKGTDRYDEKMYQDTLTLYNWVESNLLRGGVHDYGKGKISYSNDYLYYMTVRYYPEEDVECPEGLGFENRICEGWSISCLFGNMAMAVIHKKLYEITGDRIYFERALRTAQALSMSPFYTADGIFVNDRDAWCNATFAGRFVKEVMSMGHMPSMPRLKKLFINTAQSIVENCITPDGRYRGSWGGSGIWDAHSGPNWMKTNGTTIQMLHAALQCEKLYP